MNIAKLGIKKLPLKLAVLAPLCGLLVAFSFAFAVASAAPNYNFSGNVSSTNGAIPGMYAYLQNLSSSYNSETDTSGNFGFSAPSGTYNVRLTTDTSNYIKNNSGDRALLMSGVDLTDSTDSVVLNSDLSNQNFVIPTTQIVFTVKDASGNPAANIPVNLANPSGTTSVSYNGATDNFAISGPGDTGAVEPATTNSLGQVTVAVPVGASFDPNSLCAIFPTGNICDTSTVQSAGSTMNIILSAQKSYNFAGTIQDQSSNAIPGVDVLLNTTSVNNNSSSSYTNASGAYAVSALSGPYNLQLSTDDSHYISDGGLRSEMIAGLTLDGNISTNLNANMANQNFVLPIQHLTINVLNGQGQPVANQQIVALNPTGTTTGTFDGASQNFSISGPGDDIAINPITTNSSGQVVLAVPQGTILSANNICAIITASNACYSSPLTLSGDQTITIYTGAPAAPTGLNYSVNGQSVFLGWNSVSGATSYDVYRDGVDIATVTNNNYTDNNVPYGSHNYYVVASNPSGSSPPSETVAVYIGAPAAITSSATVSANMRQPFSFTVTTTGTPVSTITESGTLPSGVTFVDNGNGTATISGTAAVATNGSYPITITADNGTGTPATQSFSLVIASTTYAPVITSSNNYTATFGTPFSFIVNSTGYPVPTISKTGTLPSGVTFVNNGNGTATISGTPAATASGVYYLTITSKNASGTASQTFSLTIDRIPKLTAIKNQVAHTNTAFTMAIVTTKAYPTAVTMTAVGTIPSGLTFTDNGNGTATISGTPALTSGGVYTITAVATNAIGSVSQSFEITVDQPPVITSQASITTTVGAPFLLQVSVTGYPKPTLTTTTLPTGLVFSASKGLISGTPTVTGSKTMIITAKSVAGTTTQSFTIQVSSSYTNPGIWSALDTYSAGNLVKSTAGIYYVYINPLAAKGKTLVTTSYWIPISTTANTYLAPGIWSALDTYSAGNLVNNSGLYYIYINSASSTGSSITDTTYWLPITS